jgi:hypothetical protein
MPANGSYVDYLVVTRDELAAQHWGMHDASRLRLLSPPPSKAKETPPEQVKSGATKQRPGAAGTARGTAPER